VLFVLYAAVICRTAYRHTRRRDITESTGVQGRSDGGVYRYIYLPNQSTLNFFMWLFCLLDLFIPTEIKFLATPLLAS